MEAYSLVQNLKDAHWKNIKTKELQEIIEACAGLYLEVSASSSSATKNSTIDFNFEALNRSNASIELSSITILPNNKKVTKNTNLEANKKLNFKETITLGNLENSSPYWLSKEADLGMYTVDNQKLIGLPETPRPTRVKFNLLIDNVPFKITKDVVRRYAKRDKGEIYEPFEILPK